MVKIRLWTALSVILLLSLATGAMADDTADIADVTKFLNRTFPNDTWGRGPTRLTGKAIEAAYPKARFYYVFSPQYPVARAGQVSAVVGIDSQGDLKHLQQPADYNKELMAVGNDADAKSAGTAVMSLLLGPFGPVEVVPDDVQVEARAGAAGWNASVKKPQGQWQVGFDAQGNCDEANYKHTGPLPICIGGQFTVVAAPQGVLVGALPARRGLLVDSVEPVSIAARGGLQKGDLMVGFDGRPLPDGDTIQQMRQMVYALKQQSNAHRAVVVLRDGRTMTVELDW